MANHNLFDGWIPGVLSKEQVQELIKLDYVRGINDPASQIDYSSIDLTISGQCFEMLTGSIKPFGPYESLIAQLEKSGLIKRHEIDKDGAFTLTAKHTYVFRMEQSLGPAMRKSNFYGQATARSSVGRMDVLARLIVDGMDRFESFTPEGLDRGSCTLFIEITPITFDVRVKPGTPVTQLRLFYGHPDICELSGKELYASKIIIAEDNTEHSQHDGECLSVDLGNPEGDENLKGCAFKVKPRDQRPPDPLPLWEIEKGNPASQPDPKPYWNLQSANTILVAGREIQYLPIEKESFYILRSKELLALPEGIAVYCRAIDETMGEMRIHYAGFVHPHFGSDRDDGKRGTPLIFEVRGHDVEVVLTHGEKLARLTFYRMSRDCPREKMRPYSKQTLKLSNFFGPWK